MTSIAKVKEQEEKRLKFLQRTENREENCKIGWGEKGDNEAGCRTPAGWSLEASQIIMKWKASGLKSREAAAPDVGPCGPLCSCGG